MEQEFSNNSPDFIPESPPISEPSNSQFVNKIEPDTVKTNHSSSDDNYEIEEFEDDDNDLFDQLVDQAINNESLKNNNNNTDVVIDIMDIDDDEEPSNNNSNQIEEVYSGEQPLDDDDYDLLAQVEQIEKKLNNQIDTTTSEPPPPPSSVLSNELQKREELRMNEIQKLNRLSDGRIFPDVRPSNFHTVAFFMKSDYKPGLNNDLPPHPAVFQTKWDPQYVPMPCAIQNTRVFKIRQQSDDNNDEQRIPASYIEQSIWMWSRIENVLSMPMLSCADISTAMKHYCRSNLEFKALNYAIESVMTVVERQNFFSKVLPCMQSLCLDLRRIVTCPLPLLVKFTNYSISLSQKQIASLLANAFFSTFPQRLGDEAQFPTINFIELFQCREDDDQNSRLSTKAHKIRCILNYFARVADEMPKGVVTYTRRSIRNSKAPEWQHSTKKLTKIIPILKGTIEDDGNGMLQVDFANKVIGGGVLGGGAVQEEILFVIYPELLLARLFTEKLTSCEALIVTGCERFSRYSGYARNFRFDGDFYDVTPVDSKGRKCTQIVAIDALYITRPITQFHPRFLIREMNKAFVGFSNSPTATTVPVATGKWGCGAFNGDPQLKAILQLLAASQAGRNVVFFTFGDVIIQKEIEEMYSVIKNMLIYQVWNLLNQYYSLFCVTSKPKYNLCQFLTQFGNAPPSLPSSSLSSHVDEKPSTSTTIKFKEVPITNFYSIDNKNKRQQTNNNQTKSTATTTYNTNNNLSDVREKSPVANLSEEQIGEILTNDDNDDRNTIYDLSTTTKPEDEPTTTIVKPLTLSSFNSTTATTTNSLSISLTDFYK